MIVISREEKTVYNIVQVTDETSISKLRSKLEITSVIKEEYSLPREIIFKNIKNLSTSARSNQSGETLNALVIDKDNSGAFYFFVVKMTSKELFIAYDAASDYAIGTSQQIAKYASKLLKEKSFAVA